VAEDRTVTGSSLFPATAAPSERYVPDHPVRVVTATSLFDGHDASIHVIRRILQASGAEVIHLGHDRSVEDVARAAIQEDAQAVAVSSYQGGHMEYFRYLLERLRDMGGSGIKVFGGGGGVIVADEIQALQADGVTRIYSPADGQHLGLQGMIDDMLRRSDADPVGPELPDPKGLPAGDFRLLARVITALENNAFDDTATSGLEALAAGCPATPVVGVTGTGGAGKSSLVDELIRRWRLDREDIRIAVVAVDPTRRRGGGALLGDRIRMNAIDGQGIYMRSMATRASVGELPDVMPRVLSACRACGFDLVFVETPGIGQRDAGVAGLVDTSLYVMTPEYGAASQLEKIEMLDRADLVAINKFDRMGARDALRDVRKQVQRNREAFDRSPDTMPVFGTVASRFHDEGVTSLYHALRDRLIERGFALGESRLPRPAAGESSPGTAVIPPARVRYLAEIADSVRGYRKAVDEQVRLARELQELRGARRLLGDDALETPGLDAAIAQREEIQDPRARRLLETWDRLRAAYSGDAHVTRVRDKEISNRTTFTTLSGTHVPRVALPRFMDDGERLRWLLMENVPGAFPFTAGVFPFKRDDEDPTRMFAGEGDPARTNARFHFLSRHAQAKRLSTAFDSVTLYGRDPDERPDIEGKIGTSGVSIATLDDMKRLYQGFDLCSPRTSVSMTINGPAPAILAMFLNTAADQGIDRFAEANGRPPDPDETARIRATTFENVRGTVQADILKEDQGQNTCIFSTEFALRLMADSQEWFIRNRVRNFYSVSISGYHIAEAGANPISQLAFTLANGFTYVEAYLARGMKIDDFAQNLSFFFSSGMDPEYTVMGRVARRIWSTAMRFRYGAGERAQKLKFHVQTSGRSLHAQEMDFNDIRTTLQALNGIYDHCNSLHTNAHDEAFTTPTEESVRRALAIQLIINREWGMARNENPLQGSFIIDELTDLVEDAVLSEFDRLTERGGVLGAMETGYQRGRIQDESLEYEHRKHDGSLPIIGVNTFLGSDSDVPPQVALQRATEEEKRGQIKRLRAFQARHADQSPGMVDRLKATALSGGNMFEVLMDAVRVCSLGQISQALFEAGGQYRRSL
jgi:methylmalonyl-CoA mutase